ncbi:hypothetical protein [Paenibacillus polymyxa]|uniref:hypothetical protein n=1 Tax=Paenibacillus polymyxa TaxID=1406 RepID=UPI000424AEA9|nr:hypothetical protein [Paenibacillus polymyxa]
MDFNIKISCVLEVSSEVEGKKYTIEEGADFIAQSQSIDKRKWFIYIPSIEKFDYIEKYHFDLLIEQYATSSRLFGEFQLPIISDNIQSYTFIDPTGHAQWLHRDDVEELRSYGTVQRLDSDGIKFR